MKINCSHCGKSAEKSLGHYNRAIKLGMKMFCSKQCSNESRKTSKSEKIEVKRLYDQKYREKNLEKIKTNKKQYYQENQKEIYKRQREKRNNDEAREKHAEFCRQPEQRYKERIRRYIRLYGKNWESIYKLCICCENNKHFLDFTASNVFPDGRRHICNSCENWQYKEYGISTKFTLQCMKSRRYTDLQFSDFAKHPYLIEANKFLILLKRQLR